MSHSYFCMRKSVTWVSVNYDLYLFIYSFLCYIGEEAFYNVNIQTLE